jgi:hypothetical protein
MRLTQLTAAIGVVLVSAGMAMAAKQENKNEVDPEMRNLFHSEVPYYGINVMLGRPTDSSVTLNVYSQEDIEVKVGYRWLDADWKFTAPVTLDGGSTHEFELQELIPNREVSYQLFLPSGEPLPGTYTKGVFHTARPAGTSFTFTVQADSHLDGQTIPALYEQTLSNAVAASPDFHIDLGDTFMTDKMSPYQQAEKQYLAQRFYMGQLGHSVPLFLVLGNHDGETEAETGNNNVKERAQWSVLQRKKYFSNPEQNDFYQAGNGDQQNYYAWHWGGAQFIVLDPYRMSEPARSGQSPWNMTLGKTQYEWLAQVLANSDARFRFVFIHQLVGGLGEGGRGGLEAAALYEWGGQNVTGEDEFSKYRPDWPAPIHDLLKQYQVSAVFHGHDHFFAYQLLDGISYQLVPQPGHRNARNHQAEEYGYVEGVFLPNSGHLQIDVQPERAVVRYIRAAHETIKHSGFANGDVAFRYEILPSEH